LSQTGEDGQPLIKEGQEVMIAPLPLYHIYAFTANCMCMMVTGNHNVLITNPRHRRLYQGAEEMALSGCWGSTRCLSR
jgi:acyl-CoA synthetase (AMP-forming)/AMP-acid ligase II